MSKIRIYRPLEGLPRETGAAIYALANAIWPPEPGTPARGLDATLAEWNSKNPLTS